MHKIAQDTDEDICALYKEKLNSFSAEAMAACMRVIMERYKSILWSIFWNHWRVCSYRYRVNGYHQGSKEQQDFCQLKNEISIFLDEAFRLAGALEPYRKPPGGDCINFSVRRLHKAMLNFDPGKKNRFTTYLYRIFDSAYLNYCKDFCTEISTCYQKAPQIIESEKFLPLLESDFFMPEEKKYLARSYERQKKTFYEYNAQKKTDKRKLAGMLKVTQKSFPGRISEQKYTGLYHSASLTPRDKEYLAGFITKVDIVYYKKKYRHDIPIAAFRVIERLSGLNRKAESPYTSAVCEQIIKCLEQLPFDALLVVLFIFMGCHQKKAAEIIQISTSTYSKKKKHIEWVLQSFLENSLSFHPDCTLDSLKKEEAVRNLFFITFHDEIRGMLDKGCPFDPECIAMYRELAGYLKFRGFSGNNIKGE